MSARARDGRATALTVILVLLLPLAWSVIGLARPASATTCLPGTGTAVDPFLVASQADLEKVASAVDGCAVNLEYRQTADITLAGNWTPLSASAAFSGAYDGDGYTISGLTVPGGSAFRGLFATATTGAVFRDLTLTGVDVEGTSETGGLVGDLGSGTVQDVTVTGTVTGTGSWVAGIAGKGVGATFTRVRFDGSVTSTGTGTEVAGIVGQLGSGTITDATVNATIASKHRLTGGVVGSVSVGSITRATFAGTVSVTASTTEAGGIVGLASNSSIVDAEASGTVSGGGQGVGGVVGNASRSTGTMTISGSSFSGTVTSTGSSVGGLAGTVSSGITVTTSSSAGSVTGTRSVGGLIGYVAASSVTASYSTADVTISDAGATDPNLGGLIGAMAGVTVTDAYARGDLTNPALADDVGGLVGDAGNSSPDNVIERAYATGAVPGTAASVGGLAGGPNGDVHRDSFWDTVTSGQATSLAGTGKTTAELTTISTFNDTATVGLTTAWPIVDGWQPYVAGTTVWGICPRVNDGYPFLLWQYDSDPCTVPAVATTSTLSVTCAQGADGTLPVRSPITCTLTGADADIDILWRAAYNPTFAEGVVRTGTDGTGTLTLALPTAAAGSPITVELVAWTTPIPVGTAAGSAAGGPVPTGIPAGIPAGDAPTFSMPLGLLTVLAAAVLATAALLMTALRRRTFSGARPR